MYCERFTRTWFILILFAAVVSAAYGEHVMPSIIIFGDSTLDAGNNNYLETVVKSNFPPYGRDFNPKIPTGRFCNGFMVTDFIAERLGLPFPMPYLHPEAKGEKIVKGVNFASSGSGYFDGTAQNFNVASLKQQLQWYHSYRNKLITIVGRENASTILSEALHVISTGSNDYVNNYYLNPLLQEQYDTQEFQRKLLLSFEEFVQELYSAGARKIIATSLPALGCLPSQITLHGGGRSVCVDSINKQAAAFNEELRKDIIVLGENLKGLKLVYFDAYSMLLEASNNPIKFGFTHARRACCGLGLLATAILCNKLTPGTCSNASSYIFWDSFHPSSQFNLLIANDFFTHGLLPILKR
ncbi:hypothetical protein O6H91_20G016800 [Diphasiastrum complanatum]|uniref:Uncharacterized protein n=1 Tax=Diphasiastrum complanatum TaxID=34168 RepID=A0ACC2AN83_DIPCM|nr:hypothetical protein O6H91_20G016800 [Diphasiastrum complanatum]